ncbi:MAG: tetratricopeptide repeat protein [Muribaculaceae bacterium]|nr:tetratricopeptide repeat protein [Muribaculaceae bacterium]
MKITLRKPTLFFAAVIAAASLSIWAGKPRSTDPGAIAKAEALYLEAVDADADGRQDDAFMLLRRARELNPADPFVAAAVAEYTAGLPTTDSAMLEDAYRAVRARFEAAPADEHYGLVFASFAQQMGRVDDLIYVWQTMDSLMPSRTDPAMNLATALMSRYSQTFDRADFDRAMAIYDRLEQGAGPSLPLASRKIGAYMMMKDTAAVVSEIEKLAASAPADVNNLIIVGRLFAGVGEPDRALDVLDSASGIDPSNGKIYLARALVYRSRNDSVAYDREVFRALQAPAVEYGDKFQLLSDYVVKLYADSTQRPRIEQMFETIQEVNPGEATLHALYGAYKASVEEPEAAIEQFNYSIDLDPNQPNVWQSLVQLYSLDGNTDELLEASRKALVHFPGDPYFATNGAMALAVKDRMPQAIALLDSVDRKLIANRRQASLIDATRGDFFYRIGERDSAYVAYSRAIEEDPDNYMALNNCAYYMCEDSTGTMLDRAELYASIATAAEPENATFLDTYAWVLYCKGDYEKAREIIDRALDLFKKEDYDDQGSVDIYDHAGDIYYRSCNRREAVEFWKKALDLGPADDALKEKIQTKVRSAK